MKLLLKILLLFFWKNNNKNLSWQIHCSNNMVIAKHLLRITTSQLFRWPFVNDLVITLFPIYMKRIRGKKTFIYSFGSMRCVDCTKIVRNYYRPLRLDLVLKIVAANVCVSVWDKNNTTLDASRVMITSYKCDEAHRIFSYAL